MPISFHDYQLNLIPFGNYLYYRDLQIFKDISTVLDQAIKTKTDDSLILCSFIQPSHFINTKVIELNRFLDAPIYLGFNSGHEAFINQAFLDKSQIKLNFGFSKISDNWLKVKLIGSNSAVYKTAWSLQSASKRQLFAETACRYLISIGCSGFDTFDGWGNDPEVDWEIVQKCSQLYPLDIRLLAQGMNIENYKYLSNFKSIVYGSGEYWVDGSIGAETAALSEPYSSGNRISPMMNLADITLALESSFQLNLVPCLHVIGDAALDLVIDCLESLELSNKIIRLCHLCVVRDDQIERLQIFNKNLELVINPGFYQFWDANINLLSPLMKDTLLPYSKLFERFERVYYGSDAPVTMPDIQLAQSCLVSYQSDNKPNLIDYQQIFRGLNEKQR